VRAKYSLPERYLICPTNTSPHKNLVTLFRAFGQMKRDGTSLPLVLTGWGTDDLNQLAQGSDALLAAYDAIFQLHDVRQEEDLELGQDVFALGFVSDFEMDALIRGAEAVLAPSLYEAGSGPAIDAWKLGTLVISSNIPPVLEQIEFLHTEAFLFDPADASGIAETIDRALLDRSAAKLMVDTSRSAMDSYSWDRVADGYLRVFRNAVSRRQVSGSVEAPLPESVAEAQVTESVIGGGER
jgi:glycosyltransferase involved in cell wall biosynthesis